MLSSKSKVFYTYLWLREDGTPYYVGKGHGKRAIRKSSPQDLSRILIQEHPSEADAFAAEIFFIAYYGRKDLGTGCLRNLTDGGDNPPNQKGKKRTLETRLRIKASQAGRTLSAEAIRKSAASRTGLKRSEVARRNASDSKKRFYASAAGRALLESPEHRVMLRLCRAKQRYKLSSEQVEDIVQRVKSGETIVSVARLYKLHRMHVSHIINGRTTWCARQTRERPMIQPTCHPDRAHHANGLCAACASKEWRRRNSDAAALRFHKEFASTNATALAD